MTKLLSANFARLKKSKIFWIGVIFMFAIAVFAILNQYRNSLEYNFTVSIDSFVFGFAVIIPILSAVFSSLFFGVEYSDGTMRNKLVIGYSRASVYLASLIICTAASLIMCMAFLLGVCAVGIPVLGFFSLSFSAFASTLLGCILMVCAVCAILTAINMHITNKAIVAIVCVLLMIGLMLLAVEVDSRLSEPEMYPPNAYVTIDGSFVQREELTPNPNYLTGTKRVVYEYIRDVNPGGQALQLSRMDNTNLWPMALYSAIIVIVSTGLGLVFFRRKDLK